MNVIKYQLEVQWLKRKVDSQHLSPLSRQPAYKFMNKTTTDHHRKQIITMCVIDSNKMKQDY